MTVTRLGQLTADTQFTGDFITDGSSSPVISSVKSNTGGFSYLFENSQDPIGIGFSSVSRLRSGVWVNHLGVTGATSQVMLFRLRKAIGDATPHGVRWDEQNDEIELRIDDVAVETVAASTTPLLTEDTWMHLGIFFYVHATEGIFSFYINGAQILTFTGNTNVFASGIGAVLFGGRYASTDAWNDAYFDDFYVDSLTSEIDEAPPSKRFMWAIVDAAGASAEFSPEGAGTNVECVDDPGPPDDDTTYTKALVAGLTDDYEHSGITVPGEYQVRAVIPIAIAKKTDAGTDAELQVGLFDGMNTEPGESQFVPTTYDSIWERFSLEPDGSPWREVDVNAIHIRYSSSGSF